MATGSRTTWTWQNLSRATGLTIVAVLLILFAIGFFTGVHLDTPVAIAFLTVATGLLGLPSGVQLVLKRNGGSSN